MRSARLLVKATAAATELVRRGVNGFVVAAPFNDGTAHFAGGALLMVDRCRAARHDTQRALVKQ